jgi:hypothetical protein
MIGVRGYSNGYFNRYPNNLPRCHSQRSARIGSIPMARRAGR